MTSAFFTLLLPVAALSAALCCPPAGAQQGEVSVAETVRLNGQDRVSDDSVQVAGWGTAFIVAPGYLVTNAHVAQGALRVVDTQTGKRYAARVIAQDADNDLALLRTDAPGAPLPLAVSTPVVARMRAFTMGYPDPSQYGTDRKFAAGWVRTPSSVDGIEPMTLYLAALPGNSGSPVCNDKGQVMGVIRGGLTKPLIQAGVATRSEPMPVATPLPALLALLDEHSVGYATYGLAGALEKVAGALAPSIYLVERTERTEPTPTAVR